MIADDGPGICARHAEPDRRAVFVAPARPETAGGRSGLGLGVFIARTLLERTGAKVSFTNRVFPDHGAVVQTLAASAFEAKPRPLGEVKHLRQDAT